MGRELLGFWLSFWARCCWAHDWREGERNEVPRMRKVGRHCAASLRTCRIGASLHVALVGVSTLAPHLVVTKAVWSPCSCLVSGEIWAASGWEGVVLFSPLSDSWEAVDIIKEGAVGDPLLWVLL